jgi:hypothetical protein
MLELFDDGSACYDEVRKIELDFAVKHWAEVKKTQGKLEVFRRVKVGESVHGGAIVVDLMDRISA